ncbi:hypothetical protein [Fervidicoccus fontis]|uniref:Phosphoesterase n=1 Tax=Fervidicoccus fontis TaxID=683846 RepID=A0A7C2ZU19_9CREN|nr:hypothetical protein [Fervidicoccus fontis]PMB78006.1 MAG: hypothetical protein C0177_01445 [Fervidicoccus fontis]HEW64431.1 hypothetical protein [Fervidicoccus fontis]
MLLTKEDALIIGDWDADGAVSAAILSYMQNSRAYPSNKKLVVYVRPSGPRELRKVMNDYSGCPEFIAFLDIPYIQENFGIFEDIKKSCPNTQVIYVDHHFSTIDNVEVLRKFIDKFRLGKDKPTSMHLLDIAHEIKLQLPQRLELFAKALWYIELGRKPSDEIKETVRVVATISRALKLNREEKFWEKMVRWLSNPLPIPLGKSDLEILNKVEEEIKKRDEELEKAVEDLAISARRVGCFRFVDARKKWKRRGVSSLATRLARKFKAPVALLAKVKDGEILVIRTKNATAKKIADELYAIGMAVNTGGHRNISIVRLKSGYDLKKIEDVLVKYCRYI